MKHNMYWYFCFLKMTQESCIPGIIVAFLQHQGEHCENCWNCLFDLLLLFCCCCLMTTHKCHWNDPGIVVRFSYPSSNLCSWWSFFTHSFASSNIQKKKWVSPPPGTPPISFIAVGSDTRAETLYKGHQFRYTLWQAIFEPDLLVLWLWGGF